MSYIEKGPITGDPYDNVALYERELDSEMSGWLMFAGLMFFFTGFWNGFEGIVGLFRSSYFTGSAVFGTIAGWSIVWLIIGALQMGVAFAIFTGREWARWLGIVLVAASAFVNMLMIPVYPFWALFLLGLNVIVIYALAVRWRPAAQ